MGKIVNVKRHAGADKLYVEDIDVGEEKTRQICSGLVEHVPIEQMQGAMVVVVMNLKPVTLKGEVSNGMVLAATGQEGVRNSFLFPMTSM